MFKPGTAGAMGQISRDLAALLPQWVMEEPQLCSGVGDGGHVSWAQVVSFTSCHTPSQTQGSLTVPKFLIPVFEGVQSFYSNTHLQISKLVAGNDSKYFLPGCDLPCSTDTRSWTQEHF